MIQAPIEPVQLYLYFLNAIFGLGLLSNSFKLFLQLLYMSANGTAQRDAAGVGAA